MSTPQQQQFRVSYFNKKLFRQPVKDQYGNSRGGHNGWVDTYVYGKANAKKSFIELEMVHGKGNVTMEPFTDPVKNPYKRVKETKKPVRRDREPDDYVGDFGA